MKILTNCATANATKSDNESSRQLLPHNLTELHTSLLHVLSVVTYIFISFPRIWFH